MEFTGESRRSIRIDDYDSDVSSLAPNCSICRISQIGLGELYVMTFGKQYRPGMPASQG